MDWYYSKKGTQQGPVSLDEMRRLFAQGDIAAGDLVWHDGMADWTAAGELAELRQADGIQAVSVAGAEPVGGASPIPGVASTVGSPQRKGMAIGSMVCGIVALLTCLGIPLGLVAVVLGHMARGKARKNPGVFGGEGLALAGLLTGYLSILLSVAMIVGLLSVNAEYWREEIMRQQQMREDVLQNKHQPDTDFIVPEEQDLTAPEEPEMTAPEE